MASTVALRGRPLATLLRQLLVDAPSAASGKPVAAPAASGKPVTAPATAAANRRLYNTEGAPLHRDESGTDSGEEYDATDDGRRLTVPFFFSASDVLDPLGAPTSLGRLLALMEDAAAAPGTNGLATAAQRRGGWWVAKEDDDAVHLKVSMPGLGKEHVKVWAEQNSLVIKGEGEKDPEDDADAAPPRYTRRIELPADAFKMDKIKAEMKNGVLRVAVPKLKEEERKDVFQVKVE
uniref:SHSP domain-containing protein n=1 Tax=Oryza punctata TaxID=4537 RepID=A0A0E0L9E6_ORYPU